MILVMAYNRKDIHQAYKNLKWIGFLSEIDGHSMKDSRLLLVPSRSSVKRSIHYAIVDLAPRIFGEAYCYVPETEDERGWPASCNFMLRAALGHVGQWFKDDVFWLEPDAIPAGVVDWFDLIQDEYYEEALPAGKKFMGGYVKHATPHMTGVAVYPRDVAAVAPKIFEAEKMAWDCFAADQILPLLHPTNLIQQVFNCPFLMANTGKGIAWTDPEYRRAGFLNPEAVVFHQDKIGRLIEILDEEKFGGACRRHTVYSWELKIEEEIMTKFYSADNANRHFLIHGLDITFDYTDTFAGTMRGVLMVEDEATAAALDSLVANPANGITEISQEEYERKKKVQLPKVAKPASVTSAIHQGVPINVRQSPAVLVEDPRPSSKSTEIDKAMENPTIQKIEDVLEIGPVRAPEPEKPAKTGTPAQPKARRGRPRPGIATPGQ